MKAWPLAAGERAAALDLLRADPIANLLLIDLVVRIGEPPPPGEPAPMVIGVWNRRELIGVASLRPCVVLSEGMPAEAVALVGSLLDAIHAGLVKSSEASGALIAHLLASSGRRLLVDRRERMLVLAPGASSIDGPATAARVRAATPRDLPALTDAARASLVEEGRPDPFDTDPEGFRRWVFGRLRRATLGEVDGQIAFVAYADVQRPEGWLVQGVYTWPQWRRQGLARGGVAALARRAFAAQTAHLQLSVVEGNLAGEALYAGLGFEPAGRLRTLLFT